MQQVINTYVLTTKGKKCYVVSCRFFFLRKQNFISLRHWHCSSGVLLPLPMAPSLTALYRADPSPLLSVWGLCLFPLEHLPKLEVTLLICWLASPWPHCEVITVKEMSGMAYLPSAPLCLTYIRCSINICRRKEGKEEGKVGKLLG